MKAFIESLSFEYGALIIAIISVVLVGAVSLVRSATVRWLNAIVIPLTFAYALYWLPVWLGGSRAEYYAWEPIIIGGWFLAGVIPSALVLFMIGRYRRAKFRV